MEAVIHEIVSVSAASRKFPRHRASAIAESILSIPAPAA